MRIIIPMAGWGSRLRPHTLTIPKPMLPIAGKPIVERLVGDLIKSTEEKVTDVIFIIREDFGKAIEAKLMEVAKHVGVPGHIRYQDVPLGTAHAILCAGDFLDGNVIVAFADTLFKADYKIDAAKDGIIWVQKVADPSAFGVVKMNADGVITDFVEKPKGFVSDLAIIGIYYFKDGKYLRDEMQYLLDNNIQKGGEFWLTDAMENMKSKGSKFYKGEVIEWLDCGNKDATVYTNQRILEFIKDENLVSSKAVVQNTVVLHPCYIEDDVILRNSVIGPHVSISKGTVIESSVVKNSIIQGKTIIKNKLIENSMIGNNVKLEGRMEDLSLGDFNSLVQ
ncbi:MAG TPA: sugar phosphate nucleotidyltransferase [Chitinophagales bacterium]|nr:sugar phosphate nucleotidyltransferase [Chitinophagales bacterium]